MASWMDGQIRERNQKKDGSFWTAGINEGFINDLEFNQAFEKGARVRPQSTC